MLVITSTAENVKLMRQWASQPYAVNMVHLNSMEQVRDNMDAVAKDCIKTFCPLAANCAAVNPNLPVSPFFNMKEGEDFTVASCDVGLKILGGGCDATFLPNKMM